MTSDSGKYIFKCVVLYHNILTDTSVIWQIAWKNSRHACIDLNAFLTTTFKILPVAPECTSSNLCILYPCKLQKMRFEIVKKCDILYRNICSVSDSKTNKTARTFFVLYTFIVRIPRSAFNGYVMIAVITAR